MKVETKGLFRGLLWAVVLMPMCYRCGYVELPLDHPMARRHYIDMPREWHEAVNGGLTYSGHRFGDPTYYVGFDCNHSFNGCDPELVDPRFFVFAAPFPYPSFGLNVVSAEECASQCKALAALIAGSIPGGEAQP